MRAGTHGGTKESKKLRVGDEIRHLPETERPWPETKSQMESGNRAGRLTHQPPGKLRYLASLNPGERVWIGSWKMGADKLNRRS